MKIEIEITEEEAACVWSNNYGDRVNRPIATIARQLLIDEANEFHVLFPHNVESAVKLFRKTNAECRHSPDENLTNQKETV